MQNPNSNVSAPSLDSIDECSEPMAYRSLQRDLLHPPFSRVTVTGTMLRDGGGEEMCVYTNVQNLDLCY